MKWKNSFKFDGANNIESIGDQKAKKIREKQELAFESKAKYTTASDVDSMADLLQKTNFAFQSTSIINQPSYPIF